jgi:uncharacterized membrane protein (UPF0127 family)
MKLKNAVNSQVLFENLIRAETIMARTIGLMGKKSLPPEEAWWFTQCKAIHTCFMRIPIDCVFVDSNGKILKIYHEIKPWRAAGPVWKATDAIEMAAGAAKFKNLNVGDIIECGP